MSVIPQASKLSTGFTPTSIPGCSLWLDAADSSSLTLSGSNVTQWNDKSGNGLNVSAASSQPTYTSNVIGSLGAVTFNGSQSLSRSVLGSSLAGNSTTTFSAFIVGSYTNNTQRSIFYTWFGNVSQTIRMLLYYDGTGGHGFDFNDYPYRTDIGSVTPANNTLLLYSGVRNGSTGTLNINGGTNTATTTGLTTTNFGSTAAALTIGAFPSDTTWNMKGNICELIFYSSALTTAQRQQIEGYLARKWGLTSNLPATHPFKLTPLYTQPFSPLDIPGCQVWLDAADNNTLALAGSTLAGWIDKSGTGKAITINSAPTYSATGFNSKYPCFTFTGTNYLTVPISAIGTQDCMFVYVGKITNPSQNNTILSAGAGASTNELGLGWNLISNLYNFYQYGVAGYGGSDNTIGGNVNVIQIGTRISSTMAVFINGALPPITGTNSSSNTQTTFYIGNTGSFSFSGQICEVILYIGTTTTTQRQQLEGYLARKWGLQGSLVSAHPFKLYPPLTPVFNPLQISGCQLWLDAADRSTLTLNGSAVTQWNDKSGNGYHATGVNGPTFSSNAINFDSTSVQYFTTNYTATNSTETLFIVFTKTGSLDTFVISSAGTGGRVFQFAGSTLAWISINNIGLWNTGYNITTGTRLLQSFARGPTAGLNYYNNGTNVYSSTTNYVPTANTTTYIGQSGWLSGYSFNGSMCEIIAYNALLTAAQRQQIEAYLAQKWGLRTLPSTHPYKMFSTPFVPSQITGLSLWLDASDSASLTLSGSSVTQWKDKSGKGYHAVGNTGTGSYSSSGFNSLPTIQITSSGNMTSPVPAGTFPSGFVIFVVFQKTGANTSADTVVARTDVNSYPSPFDIYTGYGGATTTSYLTGNGGTGYNSLDATNDTICRTTTPTIWCFSLFSSSATTWNNSINGTTSSYTLNPRNGGGAYGDNATSFAIGTRPAGFTAMNGNISEIIAYSASSFSASQRQQVEGYLAWKWGLTASLPSGHPYKSIKP